MCEKVSLGMDNQSMIIDDHGDGYRIQESYIIEYRI